MKPSETARGTKRATGTCTGTSRVRRGEVDYFTDALLQKLKMKPGPFKLSEAAAPRGEGRLIARKATEDEYGPLTMYFRQRKPEDKTIKLGNYERQGDLAALRKKLRKLRALQIDTGDVKEHIREEKRHKEVERSKGSFRQLLDGYVGSLAGRPSAKAVEDIFRRNVLKPFHTLAETKAKDIGPEDVQTILARMVKKGIQRQTNVCRSYLRAAFQWGVKAEHDPRRQANDGVKFGFTVNPVDVIPVIPEYEHTRDRNLSEDELREFWIATEALPSVQEAFFRFNLAMGCQRVTQLLRARWDAFDFDLVTENYKGPVLLLKDKKGRQKQGEIERDHLLPLSDFAMEQLQPLRDLNGTGNLPFTNDGQRPMVMETLSVAVREISAKLTKEKNIAPFQMRDLRRTVETQMQKLRIDKEVRAHTLSHGRTKSDVQARSYERYDFLPEKRAALEKWAEHLQTIIDPNRKAKVIPIRASA